MIKTKTSRRGVVATNGDAVSSKWSAVNAGYYQDDFLRWFIRYDVSEFVGSAALSATGPGAGNGRGSSGISVPTARRSPLMNRGTYTRVFAIQNAAEKFLESCHEHKTPCQVVSLGAGHDTLYFRLCQAGKFVPGDRYIEMDLSEVITEKTSIISKNHDLSQYADIVHPTNDLQQQQQQQAEADATLRQYTLLAGDMNNIEELRQVLTANLDASKPALFITELALIYLTAQASDRVISLISELFPYAFWLNLEQVQPNDAFGKVMIRNLEARECALLGIDAYPTTKAQQARFVNLGFAKSYCYTLLEEYERWTDKEQKVKQQKMEFMDEFEEWQLIMTHYCIVYAAKFDGSAASSAAFAFSDLVTRYLELCKCK
mmetsp:Transcript_1079/g.1751  ORF Transcript_1079/g.1751 Transcript_1079/m.1751 type:complete len:374 (-) Transcript_1079:17-1138(-)